MIQSIRMHKDLNDDSMNQLNVIICKLYFVMNIKILDVIVEIGKVK